MSIQYEEERKPTMMETKMSLPEIILLVGTRVLLGAGIGLLISSRLNQDQRKAAGLSLAVVGGLTTIPLALMIKGRRQESGSISRAA